MFATVSRCVSVFGVHIKSAIVCNMSHERSFTSRGTSPHTVGCTAPKKLIYPAANRNKEPILNVLKEVISNHYSTNDELNFLEIASGSGQHIAHFAPNFENIKFQPTEYSSDLLGSIGIYADECRTKNIKKPILIDITKDMDFLNTKWNLIYCANMIHISPMECTLGLFSNAGKYLKENGLLITYGPYAVDGVISPESNVNFDQSLKSQNKDWGIRCISELTELAHQNGLNLKRTVEMPANNKCLVWEKTNQV